MYRLLTHCPLIILKEEEVLGAQHEGGCSSGFLKNAGCYNSMQKALQKIK
jgi:hypothetical protein